VSKASDKQADLRRDVLLDRSLRERAHELRREACGAWSDVVIQPHGGLDEAKCQYAAAVEEMLRNVIDELADLSGPAPISADRPQPLPAHSAGDSSPDRSLV
jgi:hypothetical protein